MTFKQWLLDTGERAGSTLMQSAVLYFITATAQKNSLDWKAIVAALVPAVLNVLLNAIPQLKYMGQNWWIDIGVRSARTFALVFLGALAADGADLFHSSVYTTAFFAAGSAALVILKGAISKAKAPVSITPASLVTKAVFAAAA